MMTPTLRDPANQLAAYQAQRAQQADLAQHAKHAGRRRPDDQRYDLVLLDLDGTLTDSAPGIVSSVREAYRALDLPAPSDAALRTFIGPPMQTSLLAHGVDAARLDDAMAAYREAYQQGALDAVVYPHVPELLTTLRERLPDAAIVLATSKPEVVAQQIVVHFGLDVRLDAVYGASLDESRLTKGAVLTHALASERDRTGRAVTADRMIMVGDRHHDVDGAREHGIDCIGVAWGYGGREELERAGARAVVADPLDLLDLLT